MPCFKPLKAYKGPGGKIFFDSKKGFVDRPLELPCGQCVGCRAERSRQWALRCVHEAAMHTRIDPVTGTRVPNNSFITLTYDDKHLPKDGGLHVEDWQKFAKRLRDRIGPFRFFHCGEYGDKFSRPHYHACIFGYDFTSDRVFLKDSQVSRFSQKKGFNALYVSPLLTEAWGMGHCTVGNLTYESAAYVARYIMKKATGELAETEYLRADPVTGAVWNVRPPYITMSRGGRGGKGGIGKSWFEKFAGDVYPEDEVVHDGRRFRPPRYYDSLLSSEPSGEVLLEELKSKRRSLADNRSEDLSHDRLRVRERIAERRLKSRR